MLPHISVCFQLNYLKFGLDHSNVKILYCTMKYVEGIYTSGFPQATIKPERNLCNRFYLQSKLLRVLSSGSPSRHWLYLFYIIVNLEGTKNLRETNFICAKYMKNCLNIFFNNRNNKDDTLVLYMWQTTINSDLKLDCPWACYGMANRLCCDLCPIKHVTESIHLTHKEFHLPGNRAIKCKSRE